jgi:hypothetical protein
MRIDIPTGCCNFETLFGLTFVIRRRISRVLREQRVREQHEPTDATRIRTTRPTVEWLAIEWLAANRWRTPGSWERSRVSEIQSSVLLRTLPSQPLRRVFYFRKARLVSKYPGESRNGRPGSRGSRRRGVWLKSAGPVGGNEAMSRIPMAGRTLKGSLKRRAVQSAATELIRSLVCRVSRLNRRWW